MTNLANVLLKTRRTDELAALAEKYITSHPVVNSARVSLAFKLAATHLDIVVPLLSTEQMRWLAIKIWKLSNNLAALYLMQSDSKRVLMYSNNAVTLNPSHKDVNSYIAILKVYWKRRRLPTRMLSYQKESLDKKKELIIATNRLLCVRHYSDVWSLPSSVNAASLAGLWL